jgi:hypothetical protein
MGPCTPASVDQFWPASAERGHGDRDQAEREHGPPTGARRDRATKRPRVAISTRSARAPITDARVRRELPRQRGHIVREAVVAARHDQRVADEPRDAQRVGVLVGRGVSKTVASTPQQDVTPALNRAPDSSSCGRATGGRRRAR